MLSECLVEKFFFRDVLLLTFHINVRRKFLLLLCIKKI